MTSANDRQPGGSHYKGDGSAPYQHWDFIHDAKLDWCGANATKYISRWWVKGTPTLDLQKTIHYLQKRTEQGYTSRLGSSIGLPYSRATAMAAMRQWLDGGAAAVPEYEQGIITQIILGNNEQAIALAQKLLDNDIISSGQPRTPAGALSIKQSHRVEGKNFVD